MRETYGHYDGPFALTLALGFALTLQDTLSRRFNLPRRRTVAISKGILSIATLYFCASLWSAPGLIYASETGPRSLLTLLLTILPGVAAIFICSTFFDRQPALSRLAPTAFWAAIFVLVAARVLTLFASPKPFIDVFSLTNQATDYLLSGLNPYTQTYPDLYGGTFDYPPGINYWPAYYLWSVPFRLLGDIRIGSVIADTVTTIVLLKVLEKIGVDEQVARLSALSWLSFPMSLFVTEQAWIEPAIAMFIVVLLWCMLTEKWRMAGLVLGVVAGIKQHMILLALLTAAYAYRRGGRRSFFAVAIGSAISFVGLLVPFVLGNDHAWAFIQQTVLTYLHREMRFDSLSLPAYFANEHNLILGNATLIGIYVVSSLLSVALILKRPPSRHVWMGALVICYGALFLFGKQAFCNYYYLLSFLTLLSSLLGNFDVDPQTTPSNKSSLRLFSPSATAG